MIGEGSVQGHDVVRCLATLLKSPQAYYSMANVVDRSKTCLEMLSCTWIRSLWAPGWRFAAGRVFF
jgi:hypothetical protein